MLKGGFRPFPPAEPEEDRAAPRADLEGHSNPFRCRELENIPKSGVIRGQNGLIRRRDAAGPAAGAARSRSCRARGLVFARTSNEQRALSDLGYVGSGEVLELAEALDFQALADPYAKYPLYERMLAVSQLIATGELEAATVELRLLAGLEPENPALLERLAEVLLYRGGDFLEEAERSYRRVLQMRPRRTQSLLGLANVALLRSEALRQRMLEELEAGRDASARTLAETWRPLARRSAEGFRRVLEEEPTHPTALHNLSTLLVSMSEDAYMRGQRAEAKRSLQEARRLLLRLMDALEETDARRVAYETQRRVLEQRLREL